MIPFDHEDRALAWANATRKYGLAASVWTKDLSRAHRFAAAARHCLGELLDAARPAHAVRQGEGLGRGTRGRLERCASSTEPRTCASSCDAGRRHDVSTSERVDSQKSPGARGPVPPRATRGQPAVPVGRGPQERGRTKNSGVELDAEATSSPTTSRSSATRCSATSATSSRAAGSLGSGWWTSPCTTDLEEGLPPTTGCGRVASRTTAVQDDARNQSAADAHRHRAQVHLLTIQETNEWAA